MLSRRRLPLAVITFLLAVALSMIVSLVMDADEVEVKTSDRLFEARRRVLPRLCGEVEAAGLRLGGPVFIRSFKESRELEVWLESSPGGRFVLFRTYPVVNWGEGTLGPKLAEGDGQSPEGFYAVGPTQLNPNSNYHLSFSIGYPNTLYRSLGRTGSLIMVHGEAESIGCLAVTDKKAEKIYLLVEAALCEGQRAMPIHLFPFRLTAGRLASEASGPWYAFWDNLREGYDFLKPLNGRRSSASETADSSSKADDKCGAWVECGRP
jgi:murein L,D-transpeptidase YafK